MPNPADNPAGLAAAFAAAMAASGLEAAWPAAVAVSGGGDSLALMLLMAGYARARRLPLPQVVTVDHALRSGSRREALQTVRWARAAGLQASILTRKGVAPSADIEAFARLARYQLIGTWAEKHKISNLYLAHNQDDQAETFLMRLIRGSGVDGLAAMRPIAPFPVAGFPSLSVVRPLLGFSRLCLRGYLTTRGQGWIDDPMNEDDRFTRVKLRQAMPMLEGVGLSRARLADTAAHLARAAAALEQAADALEIVAVIPSGEGVLIDPAQLCTAPEETALRLLARLLMRISGQGYRPRFERLIRLYDAVAGGTLGRGRTLHGCKIGPAPRRLWQGAGNRLFLCREPAHQPRKK